MASNRIGRINEEIQKELASLLRNLKDPRVQNTMISITRVETTPDLRFAKVYVSFLEEDKAKDALKGLKSAGGYLRRELGRALNLRYTPELMWALDDSITYGAKMLKLINSLEVKNDEQPDEERDCPFFGAARPLRHPDPPPARRGYHRLCRYPLPGSAAAGQNSPYH